MNREKTVQLLEVLGCTVPKSQPRAGWVVCDCALGPWNHTDGKSSSGVFGVETKAGDARFNCFACEAHGTLSDLVFEVKLRNKKDFARTYDFKAAEQLIAQAESELELDGLDAPDVEQMLFGKKSKPHVFPDWWLDTFPSWKASKIARDYLHHGRKSADPVLPEIADFLDLRFDANQRRICFPIRNFSGHLMGLHGRAIDVDVEPRYRMYLQSKRNNPDIWFGEHWIDLDLPIVVVEGPFDLASVLRVYPNVCTPLFASPSARKLSRLADCMEWVTLFDRGTGGDKGREKVSRTITDSVVRHVVPPEDFKDPGEMTKEALVQVLSPFVSLSDFSIASGATLNTI